MLLSAEGDQENFVLFAVFYNNSGPSNLDIHVLIPIQSNIDGTENIEYYKSKNLFVCRQVA